MFRRLKQASERGLRRQAVSHARALAIPQCRPAGLALVLETGFATADEVQALALTWATQDAQSSAAPAQPDDQAEYWAGHGQDACSFQYHPGFGSGIPTGRRRPWSGAEIRINSEVDQALPRDNKV